MPVIDGNAVIAPNRTMTTITPLEKLTVPLGGQVIELQQLDYAAGGMSLLRTRIREKSRFTVFEIDPQTARFWGEALLRWAQTQPQAGAAGDPV
ncbi:hypothetical protein [Polaromonas sp.]|uniref:DUF6967 family protein n=1 Tax=Polaromonas sp. TaxID=1869339 RepID=UPI0025D8607E|nr:hypothetical protein [Polaromonas sp.]